MCWEVSEKERVSWSAAVVAQAQSLKHGRQIVRAPAVTKDERKCDRLWVLASLQCAWRSSEQFSDGIFAVQLLQKHLNQRGRPSQGVRGRDRRMNEPRS